jgi:hypothetical protein
MSKQVPVAQIPMGVWHGFWVREPGTAILEVKAALPPDFAGWAPVEGDVGGDEFPRPLAPRSLGRGKSAVRAPSNSPVAPDSFG